MFTNLWSKHIGEETITSSEQQQLSWSGTRYSGLDAVTFRDVGSFLSIHLCPSKALDFWYEEEAIFDGQNSFVMKKLMYVNLLDGASVDIKLSNRTHEHTATMSGSGWLCFSVDVYGQYQFTKDPPATYPLGE